MFKWLGKATDLTNPVEDHDEAACARRYGDCACIPLPSVHSPVDNPVDDEAGADEAEPYAVRSNPRAPRGFWASKGLDLEFVIIGEAGMYVGTIVDVCADLEAGSYAGESLISEVWRRVEDPQGALNPTFEPVIINTGWPIPGDKTEWPDHYGNVRVGLYTRTLIDATDNERRLAESGNGLRCLAWATFMIDGAA